jgi:hypothetical protein
VFEWVIGDRHFFFAVDLVGVSTLFGGESV